MKKFIYLYIKVRKGAINEYNKDTFTDAPHKFKDSKRIKTI